MSELVDRDRFLAEYRGLYQEAERAGVPVVIGGRVAWQLPALGHAVHVLWRWAEAPGGIRPVAARACAFGRDGGVLRVMPEVEVARIWTARVA